MSLTALLELATSKIGIAVICFVVGWGIGYRQSSRSCDARNLAETIRQLRTDLEAAKIAARTEQAMREAIAKEVEVEKDQVDAYRRELESRGKNDACRLDDDDLRRLRVPAR
jgi:hypothetical protein